MIAAFTATVNINVNPVKVPCNSVEDVIKEIENIGENREDLTFGIDGAVVKVDDLRFREILGATAKTPRWAVAYKYPPEEKESVLKEIELSVGRTGRITPPCYSGTDQNRPVNQNDPHLHPCAP